MGSLVKNVTGICVPMPSINSGGLFKHVTDMNIPVPVRYNLPILHLRALIIFITIQVIQYPLKRFGFSELLSQIITGIILSPSALGGSKIFGNVLSHQPEPDVFVMLSQLALTYFIFIKGVELDISMISRVGRKAWALAIASFLPPTVVADTYAFSTNLPKWKYFMATLQPYTSLPVVSGLLNELKLANTELGRLGLSAALISDTSSAIVFMVLRYYYKHQIHGIRDAGIFLMYLLFLFLVARRGMFWVIRQTPEGKPVKDIYIYGVLAAMYAACFVSREFTSQFVYGGYFLGLAVPHGPPFGSAVVKKTEFFINGVLLPLLTTTCMMMNDFASIFKGFKLVEIHRFCIMLIALVILTKFIVTFLVALCCKIQFNHAVAVALIMSYHGIIHLFDVTFAILYKIIPEEVFTIFSIFFLINTAIVPNLVRVLYNKSKRYVGYQTRNIVKLKPNSELKVIACIHRPEDIASVKNLFNFFQPTRECPITAHVLHLVELAGQINPVFISHNLQKKKVSAHSYSAAVVHSFCDYELNNRGAISIDIFTAVSPANTMQEDISTLALDKMASLIILPFHRKWSHGGLHISESSTVRALNCSVLETAPCSVGILVDRTHMRDLKSRSSSEFLYHIGVIFAGGNDDWEAISLARRMAREPHICLTVFHLRFAYDGSDTKWDNKLDNLLMEDIKSDSWEMQNLIYKEEHVSDGAEMAERLRPMMDECDIFLVGRSHSSETSGVKGLPEWSEFPELGVIGDLLASADFNAKASVLILQQQDLKL